MAIGAQGTQTDGHPRAPPRIGTCAVSSAMPTYVVVDFEFLYPERLKSRRHCLGCLLFSRYPRLAPPGCPQKITPTSALNGTTRSNQSNPSPRHHLRAPREPRLREGSRAAASCAAPTTSASDTKLGARHRQQHRGPTAAPSRMAAGSALKWWVMAAAHEASRVPGALPPAVRLGHGIERAAAAGRTSQGRIPRREQIETGWVGGRG